MAPASPWRSRAPYLLTAVLSLGLHGAAWGVGRRLPRLPPPRPIEVEVVRRAAAPRPAPPPPAPPPPAPRPERPAPPRSPPPPVVALVRAAPPQAEPPPPEAPRPLPRVGLSLGATVAGGGFSMGVGNTALGKAGSRAADPAEVRPLPAGPAPGSTPARPLHLPRIPYPPEARRAGAEGQVLLLLRLDAAGAVTAVRVLAAPDPALAAAAAEGARRFRFAPATEAGEPVETEIRFTYTFLLE